MKILPCRNPHAVGCGGTAWTPGGDRYWIRRYPGSAGALARYSCARCGSGYTLTPSEFHALPDATPDQLGSRVATHVAGGHTLGGEIPLEQAFDLAEAGFTVAQVAELASSKAPSD